MVCTTKCNIFFGGVTCMHQSDESSSKYIHVLLKSISAQSTYRNDAIFGIVFICNDQSVVWPNQALNLFGSIEEKGVREVVLDFGVYFRQAIVGQYISQSCLLYSTESVWFVNPHRQETGCIEDMVLHICIHGIKTSLSICVCTSWCTIEK